MELIIFFVIICFILQGQSITNFDVTVAQDGSGNYSRIMDAISAAPVGRINRYYIKIKEGNYTEYVVVDQNHTNLTFIGDGVEKTIISGSKSWGRDHISTYETATVAIKGYGFVAMDITFENTAGPENEQAVALVSDVDSSFYRCKFVGYQDTLYARQNNQFYRECDIFGTIDFIFGDASAVFQNCNIYARFPGEGHSNAVTAQGRAENDGSGGTVIQNCTITAAEDLRQKRSTIKSYLGRPWKNFSRTVVMQSFIDDVIDPEGWLEWEGNRVDTLYYGEYNNRGPGSDTSRRVHWKGYHRLGYVEAAKFTVRNFIQGDRWIPSEIPYFLDLM